MTDGNYMRPRLTPARRRVLDKALDEILALEGAERADRLDQFRQRYPRLSIWLDELVEASTRPTRFMQTVMRDVSEAVAAGLDEMSVESLPAGTRLGPWRLLEMVGSGGMGTVYRAERADGAFEMTAAAKLIRHRRDQRLAERLRLERELLARLDHPNIARILDGGTTEDGQAWLAMEWVPGQDLSTACQTLRTQPGAIIKAFDQICRAVEHAHQRGVIHGDIKPANVRLTPEGQIRLLDFGVARLIAEDQGASSGAIALTPAFSAPEQSVGEPASTQSDIWSLGALLCWMLSGKRPGPVAQRELERRLKGWEPRHRDLAAIITMACAMNPDERYADVGALRADLRRYRDLRPIEARKSTSRYVAARFIRRNPVGVSLGGLAIALLLAGLAGTSWQAHVAGLERDRAQLEASRTARVSEFLVELFEHADPFRAPGEELTASQILEEGRDRITALDETPLVQAEMLRTLGRVHFALGEYEQAETLSRAAVERLDATATAPVSERAAALTQLGRVLASQGQVENAEAKQRLALELASGRYPARRVEALSALGMTLRGAGRLEEANEALEQALALQMEVDPDSLLEAEVRHNLGYVLFAQTRYAAARDQFERVLDLRRDLLGSDHPLTWSVAGDLGHAFGALGDMESAETLMLEEVELQTRNLGPDHPHVGDLQYGVGILRTNQERHEEALDWFNQSLATRQASLAASHPSIGLSHYAVGAVLRRLDRLEEALQSLELAAGIYHEHYGDIHPRLTEVWLAKGNVYRGQGDYELADEWLQKTLRTRLEIYGREHHHVGNTLSALAGLHREAGNIDQALEHAREALAVYESMFDDQDHPSIAAARERVAAIQQELDPGRNGSAR